MPPIWADKNNRIYKHVSGNHKKTFNKVEEFFIV